MIRKALACLMSISILICMVGCGHEHSMAERTLKEKTCTTDGEIEHYCTDCDFKYTEKIEASHNYEKTVIKESTCTTNGEEKYICKDCGDTYDEELPLSSHLYENKYCTVCGDKKMGKITTSYVPKTFNYGAAGVVRTTCKITEVKVELNYGIMTVYFSGTKTYDCAGDSMNGPVSFMMIVKDKYGSVIYSDQIMTHCVVNQTFSIKTIVNCWIDDSEDYRIELSDYMM